MIKFEIFNLIEEQAIVSFTGKINLMSKTDQRHIGSIFMIDGKVVNATKGDMEAYKSFINLCVDSTAENVKYIVEPELITTVNKKIDTPLSILKKRVVEVYDDFQVARKNKPPQNLKILPKVDYLESNEEVTANEFSLFCTLSDYNSVKDIYTYSELLEYEITNTLMSLRKKNAIKLIQVK